MNTANKNAKPKRFEELLLSVGYRYELPQVFSDFLIMTLCAFAQNPLTGNSYNEALYMETVAKYDKPTVTLLASMLGALVIEMDERVDSDSGNDVLGEFYELHLGQRNRSQFFTPWPICRLMAECLHVPPGDQPVRILEPTCGSGRMLLAAAKSFGPSHEFYGIDIDRTCIEMAALNLFLNGIFHAEVMCADALNPEDFRVSYRTSYLPFGVFRIDRREDSPLWNMMQHSTVTITSSSTELPSENSSSSSFEGNGSQLQLF